MNSGDFYKVPIKNGYYLFFAKPDTEYNVYYHTNNNFDYNCDNTTLVINYLLLPTQ